MDVPVPTGLWLAAQAIPSIEVVVHEGAAHSGARWQLTPLLYSFGVNRRTDPIRTFVVDPFARQSGSIEAYVSPEFFSVGPASDRLSLRLGTRAYFPLVSRGEYLSVSFGTSYSSFARGGVGYEAGAYVLFGVLGVQATYSPSPGAPPFIGTLSIRIF